jgi:hypothetical protein
MATVPSMAFFGERLMSEYWRGLVFQTFLTAAVTEHLSALICANLKPEETKKTEPLPPLVSSVEGSRVKYRGYF